MMGFLINRRAVLATGLTTALLRPRPIYATDSALTWGIDYGADTDPAIARSYDLLVLEPDHARPIAPLRGPKSQLLGYVSLGEVECRRPFAKALDKEGALKTPNANWPDARFVDLRHPLWTSLLLDVLIPEILAKGYDGIFMDTLDNAEAMERADPAKNVGMVRAAVNLVKAIRQRFPATMIMLNRGYALLPDVAAHIDAILGEAMASRWNFATERYELTSVDDWMWQANLLRAAKQANSALILTTLDYWDTKDPATIAKLYERERAAEFHPYVATLALNQLLPEPIS
jgi:polysaccharide biosynthesis protein PelA